MISTLIFAIALGTSKTQSSDEIRRLIVPLETVDPRKNLDELAFLTEFVKGKSVVALGEATHGTQEFFQMKHRVFRYLVEKEQFTVFGIEASMPDCEALNDYVVHGKGDPKVALSDQGFWTWNTEEVLDLIKWMREYNVANPQKPQLKVFGFDMQNRSTATLQLYNTASEITPESHPEEWLRLAEIDEFQQEWIREQENTLVGRLTARGETDRANRTRLLIKVLKQAEENDRLQYIINQRPVVVPIMATTFSDALQLQKDIEDPTPNALTALKFIEEYSDKLIDYEKLDRASTRKMIDEGIAALSSIATKQSDAVTARITNQISLLDFLKAISFIRADRLYDFRDKCMSENIEFAHQELFAGEKLFIWAHNGHVSKESPGDDFRPMGWYISQSQQLSDQYLNVGFAFYEGTFAVRGPDRITTETVGPASPVSWESLFHQMGKDRFFIPTKNLTGSRPTRNIGATYNRETPEMYDGLVSLATAFDAVIYIKTSRPSRQLP